MVESIFLDFGKKREVHFFLCLSVDAPGTYFSEIRRAFAINVMGKWHVTQNEVQRTHTASGPGSLCSIVDSTCFL